MLYPLLASCSNTSSRCHDFCKESMRTTDAIKGNAGGGALACSTITAARYDSSNSSAA